MRAGTKKSKQDRYFSAMVGLFLILPLVGCSSFRPKAEYKWHLTLEIDPSVEKRELIVHETAELLRNRLNRFEVGSFSVDVTGRPEDGHIQVKLPQVADPQRVKSFITSQGLLQLVHVVSEPSPAPWPVYATQEEANTVATSYSSAKALPFPDPRSVDNGNSIRWIVAEFPPIIESKHLRTASAVPDYVDKKNYEIHFTLTPAGATKFGVWTAAHINEYIAVVLNNEVKSIAFIKSQITDTAVINGRFTKESAEDLAQVLLSGPLPAPVRIVEEGTY